MVVYNREFLSVNIVACPTLQLYTSLPVLTTYSTIVSRPTYVWERWQLSRADSGELLVLLEKRNVQATTLWVFYEDLKAIKTSFAQLLIFAIVMEHNV